MLRGNLVEVGVRMLRSATATNAARAAASENLMANNNLVQREPP
jgi:hypothetical protein